MEFDFSYDNIGGLRALYAIPVESFVRLRRDYVADTYNLELRAKDNIIIIPVLNDSSYSLDTSQEESSHGDATRIIIEGVIPRLDKMHKSILERLKQGYWYVLAKDQNGVPYWCGLEETLMKFSYTYSTGKQYSSLNAASFTFSNMQDSAPVIIEDIEI